MHRIINLVVIVTIIHSASVLAQTTGAKPLNSGTTTIQSGQNVPSGNRTSTSGSSATITTDPVTNVPTITLINPANKNPARRTPVVNDATVTVPTPPAQTVGSASVPNAAASTYRSEFDAMDSDGDGAISWDEFARSGNTAGFTSIDQNGDLKISPSEWRNYMRRRAAE